ncbi:Sugar kinase of the NBD/HSP70 family, may contain an N-terminal HTH domain [Lentzea xinjiangensis]|uniref:Sugar kinase of the NBD/HSP70 family, may contain an N-terminal HTH domain n=1 Tax=Lentzea xinjiangensis TaxID=402600 RepID=A0A1H9LTS9_9PSEU|nr:ROK family transcriptional regulator [Lentzea xinjiangensis]SER14824.1 Sugar kinase of the NBD/HSP70 family, may contain an N-terminal HTH domain [Lentzea xinjiangensis]
MSGPARVTHASTRAAVLDLIRAAGVISRVGLAGASGLTGGTISTVVRGLIDEGLVAETGHAESTGGKRRVMLQLNHFARYAVGVHLDDARITCVLTNLGGAVVARISRARAGADDPATVVAAMAREVDAVIESAGVDRDRVLGLGLVSARPSAHDESGRLLERATGLPVVLDDDATAAAIGEHWSGGVGATATFAALYMGTGIGAGVVLGGTTYRGPSGHTGEIGHACLDVDGPRCRCGARGCLEVLAGPAAVVARAREDRALSRAAGLAGGRTRAAAPVAADFAAISRAARQGNPRAVALLERSARYVAAAARTLANLLDLEVLVLTGPSFAIAGAVYLPVLRAELDEAFIARDAHPVAVRLSPSAASAPAIGAAAIVLQSELVPRRQGLRLPDDLAADEPPVFRQAVR